MKHFVNAFLLSVTLICTAYSMDHKEPVETKILTLSAHNVTNIIKWNREKLIEIFNLQKTWKFMLFSAKAQDGEDKLFNDMGNLVERLIVVGPVSYVSAKVTNVICYSYSTKYQDDCREFLYDCVGAISGTCKSEYQYFTQYAKCAFGSVNPAGNVTVVLMPVNTWRAIFSFASSYEQQKIKEEKEPRQFLQALKRVGFVTAPMEEVSVKFTWDDEQIFEGAVKNFMCTVSEGPVEYKKEIINNYVNKFKNKFRSGEGFECSLPCYILRASKPLFWAQMVEIENQKKISY